MKTYIRLTIALGLAIIFSVGCGNQASTPDPSEEMAEGGRVVPSESQDEHSLGGQGVAQTEQPND